MIYNFDFLISPLTDIAQKFFCTPDGATDPTFQPSSIFVAGDISPKNQLLLVKNVYKHFPDEVPKFWWASGYHYTSLI